MEKDLLSAVSKQVYRNYPEFKGIQPKVQMQHSHQPSPVGASPTYLLIYSMKVFTAEKKNMPRSLRVVVDGQGKILKMSTSH